MLILYKMFCMVFLCEYGICFFEGKVCFEDYFFVM